MSSMELFIIMAALAAAAGGTLILLACMANKRMQLIKAFNIQQEIETQQATIEQNIQESQSDKKGGSANVVPV